MLMKLIYNMYTITLVVHQLGLSLVYPQAFWPHNLFLVRDPLDPHLTHLAPVLHRCYDPEYCVEGGQD